VAERARVLADQLTDIEADFFVLIGHSMGGLDARHLVANFNLSKPVLQVVTLSTPHHGTEVAEWLLTGRGALHRLAQRFWRRALEDLTQEACFCRNTRFEDRSDICYISYAAERQRKDLPFWLRPLARALEEPNDGLVTVSSAEWGKLRGVMKADHFEMVGWSLAPSCEAAERPFAHLALYESIIRDVNGSEELY
jgi:triacylglycerol lipase